MAKAAKHRKRGQFHWHRISMAKKHPRKKWTEIERIKRSSAAKRAVFFLQVTCLLWMYGAIHQSRCEAYIFLPRTRVVYVWLMIKGPFSNFTMGVLDSVTTAKFRSSESMCLWQKQSRAFFRFCFWLWLKIEKPRKSALKEGHDTTMNVDIWMDGLTVRLWRAALESLLTSSHCSQDMYHITISYHSIAIGMIEIWMNSKYVI